MMSHYYSPGYLNGSVRCAPVTLKVHFLQRISRDLSLDHDLLQEPEVIAPGRGRDMRNIQDENGEAL
jgi:hypothetical protein